MTESTCAYVSMGYCRYARQADVPTKLVYRDCLFFLHITENSS